MKLSVLIPSRLQVQDNSSALWLERAVRSVRSQQSARIAEIEIVVGIDANVVPPGFPNIIWAEASAPGQAAAVNAAARKATGDLVAILEDDDAWVPERIKAAVVWLSRYDVVTSNQREVRPNGEFVRINDFPTPSGWLLRRDTWLRLGPLDETYRYHLDNEYLGRMTAMRLRRLHLVERGALRGRRRRWIDAVNRFSDVVETRSSLPLVERTVNPSSGMARIASDPVARAVSIAEYERLTQKYATVPW